MSIVCRRGHQVLEGSRFCPQCGEPLLIVESQPVGAVSPREDEVEPLPTGTYLRERYIIQRQLGHGGFGRTYLAEDTGRFGEKFVIKEFMPSMRNTQALKKAEELFQREAAILHQLEHPQIPRFWEIFRQGSQIFLVVDYVEGPTYKSLLEQRLQQGKFFSETEILDLLQKLLPVLSYLHRRGVIHRDISPDNIILRIEDRLPVLIDMGGVKQVAMEVGTQLESGQNHINTSVTCLGKVAYAPPEQLLIGLVAPHSDLYALAVSVLELMTGEKPPLLEQDKQQWLYEQDLKVSPLLIGTLNKMLAQKPAHRFQSADEVLQVLNLTLPNVPQQNSGLREIPRATFSGFPGQPEISTNISPPPQVGQHKPTSLQKNWRAVPGPVKFLVLALIVIFGGMVYFFGKNQLFLPSKPTLAKLNLATESQLPNSMREVQNVPSGLFNYGGAPAFAALNRYMNEAISKAHPEFRLRYAEPLSGTPGSGTGIEMLINGELSIAQSGRPIEEDEYSKAKARGFPLEQVPVTIDGVVFYTNVNLNIPGLSVDQLQEIFRGKVTNWQQVGGPNLPIEPVALDPKLTSALKLLLGGQGEDIGRNVQVVRDFTTAIRKVAAAPGGISYASASLVINQKTIRPIAMAKANTKQYVQPFTENKQVNAQAFQDGSYPMTRQFYIVIRRDGTVEEKAGVAYTNMLLSPEGQKIMQQAGFVPIR